AETAVGRPTTDRTGRSVLTLRTVAGGLALEVVTLHDACRALALARAGHVNVPHLVKDVDVNSLAQLQRAGSLLVDAELAVNPLGAQARLAVVTDHRERRVATLDVLKSQLHRTVTVGLGRLDLTDVARAGLDDRHRH